MPDPLSRRRDPPQSRRQVPPDCVNLRTRQVRVEPFVELAQRMIDFYWEDQSRSIGVEFSGLRPGEKIDERLVYPYEQAVSTSHPMIRRLCARPGMSVNGHGEDFERALGDLIDLGRDHGDARAIVAALVQCVPEYTSPEEVPLEKRAALV